jgi:hypothetical protein
MFLEIPLFDHIIWWEERGHVSKLVWLLLWHHLNLCFKKLWLKMYKFPIMTSVVSCLPEMSWNVQSHPFCEQKLWFIGHLIVRCTFCTGSFQGHRGNGGNCFHFLLWSTGLGSYWCLHYLFVLASFCFSEPSLFWNNFM